MRLADLDESVGVFTDPEAGRAPNDCIDRDLRRQLKGSDSLPVDVTYNQEPRVDVNIDVLEAECVLLAPKRENRL